MALQVVGAGVGRTGTHSLKIALEQLCGGTCHHMIEVFERPDQIAGFTAAVDGEPVDWSALLADFTAMVDFPGALYWREIAAANPDAPILLSSRDAEGWYTSASNTILLSLDHAPPPLQPWMAAVRRMLHDRFSDDFENKDAMIAAYEAHNAAVRAEVRSGAAHRLDAGRRVGPDLRRARQAGSRRAVPRHQHDGRVPGEDRRRSAVTSKEEARFRELVA